MPQSQLRAHSVHPNRVPTHVSVSLRHGSPASSEPHKAQDTRQRRRPSNASGEQELGDARRWFNQCNENPGKHSGVDRAMIDGDPPFFLLNRQGCSATNQDLEPAPSPVRHGIDNSKPSLMHATTSSSADDFRSVIDDLTIENKKLKELLRKHEADHSVQPDRDRLFEVKIYGLSSSKRRELEDTLQRFAASVAGSAEIQSPQGHSRPHHDSNMRHGSRHASSPLTSDSRPLDSAYASMSTFEPKPLSLESTSSGERPHPPSMKAKHQNIRSYLHDIPEGLLPKHPPELSEKARKKLIVKRLEQLFTGKKSSAVGEHSQPYQQQKISESAAHHDRREKEKNGKCASSEGVREARILSNEMAVDISKPVRKMSTDDDSLLVEAENGSVGSLDGSDQRPTRPLDLDPDRAQIPSENIDYIRHLGISTPGLDAHETDVGYGNAGGWVYLNLLIDMAQLHTINVTPDFVRSAVAEVSAKFQLSDDGRKLRWRGGTEGTHLSSDSGAEPGLRESPDDSDSLDGPAEKRRRISTSPRQQLALNPSWERPQSPRMPGVRRHDPATGRLNQLHYKPLFLHHRSSQASSSADDSMSLTSSARGEESGTGHAFSSTRPFQTSHSRPSGKTHQRNAAPKIFYGGAPFYTDLSGDLGDVSPPLYITGMDQDGYSKHTHDASGCTTQSAARPTISRDPSVSVMNYKPFKDYSKCAEEQMGNARPKTPDLITEDAGDDMGFSPHWSSASCEASARLLSLDASGLGGTRPADHFAVTVETRRIKLDGKADSDSSRSCMPGRRGQTSLSSVSKATLESLGDSGQHKSAEAIISRLAALSSVSAASLPAKDGKAAIELPVRTEIAWMQTRRLEPSRLPPPASYFPPFSDSDDASETTPSSGSQSGAATAPVFGPGSDHVQRLGARDRAGRHGYVDVDMSGDDDDFDDGEDSGGSIDLLTHARLLDPADIAAKEREFELATRQPTESPRVSSSAAAVDDESDEPGSSTLSESF
ncbi:MAG: hypothetical protein M1818_007823 [Claussenomyces sp. TS43310]|nr:MAG: hypothetical protein M1818_007823 [Claussenomyces sp. TS43310]